jgi:hypothetical protein
VKKGECCALKWREVKRNEGKWSEVKRSEVKWNEVKWDLGWNMCIIIDLQFWSCMYVCAVRCVIIICFFWLFSNFDLFFFFFFFMFVFLFCMFVFYCVYFVI